MMFSCKTVPQSFEFLGGVFATQTQEGQICYVEGRAGCRNVSVAAHGAGQGAQDKGSVGERVYLKYVASDENEPTRPPL